MAADLVSHRRFLFCAAHGAVLFLAALLIVVFSLLSPPLFSQKAQVVVDWMWRLLMRLGGGVKNGVFCCFRFRLLGGGGNGVFFLVTVCLAAADANCRVYFIFASFVFYNHLLSVAAWFGILSPLLAVSHMTLFCMVCLCYCHDKVLDNVVINIIKTVLLLILKIPM